MSAEDISCNAGRVNDSSFAEETTVESLSKWCVFHEKSWSESELKKEKDKKLVEVMTLESDNVDSPVVKTILVSQEFARKALKESLLKTLEVGTSHQEPEVPDQDTPPSNPEYNAPSSDSEDEEIKDEPGEGAQSGPGVEVAADAVMDVPEEEFVVNDDINPFGAQEDEPS